MDVFRWAGEAAARMRDLHERPASPKQQPRVRRHGAQDDKLLDRLSEVLREMRDWRRTAARQARRQSLVQGTLYKTALLALYQEEIRSSCPRRTVICFAAAAELGLDLGGDVAIRQLEDAELPAELRAMYWAAIRRLAGRLGSQ